MLGTMLEARQGVWRLRALRGYKADGSPIQASRTVRGTKRRAAMALAKFVAEVERGASAKSGAPTFGVYLIERYLPHVKANLSPETYRNHASKASKASKRLVPDLGHLRLDKLTAAHLDSVYVKWCEEGLQPSTVKAHHLVVSCALTQAVKWQLLPRSVAPMATLPRVEQGEHLVAPSGSRIPRRVEPYVRKVRYMAPGEDEERRQRSEAMAGTYVPLAGPLTPEDGPHDHGDAGSGGGDRTASRRIGATLAIRHLSEKVFDEAPRKS